MLKKLVQTNNSFTTLVLRLALGIVFFPHGAQKFLGWFGGFGFTGTMSYFTQVAGIPAVLAFLVIVAEFFGALGLITGLLTRIAAFGIAAIMLVAVLMVHSSNGFFMNWEGTQKGEGFEYHILAFAIAAALMIRGGGLWSLDNIVRRSMNERTGRA
ncbi:MAG: DoxX family protein [Pyrinomonadaceae bacterium]